MRNAQQSLLSSTRHAVVDPSRSPVLPPDIPRQPAVDVSIEFEELRAKLVPQSGSETRHCPHQLASGKRCHEPQWLSLAPHFRFPICSCLPICWRGWTIAIAISIGDQVRTQSSRGS